MPLRCHYLCDSPEMECGELYENLVNSRRNLLGNCPERRILSCTCVLGKCSVWQHSQMMCLLSSELIVFCSVLHPLSYSITSSESDTQ